MWTRSFLAVLSTAILVGSAAYGQTESFPSCIASPQAVEAVRAGRCAEADASWWGFVEEDSTEALQAALDSGAPKVIIPYMGKPWITRPLTIPSNREIVLQPGVVVLAKRGEFRGTGDSLFRAHDASNITVRGYGATLRMHKRDYQQEPYAKAEWRMGLCFSGCTNVRIEGLRIESSGGDGIYIGATGQQPYCKDVVIRDVVCWDNHRQGISVIGADNLLIENSVFANTWGTAPGAGIDLEPDNKEERLVNIVVRDCVFEDNEGHEILVYPKNLDAASPPISIRFEDCLIRKTTLDGVAKGIGRDDASHGWAGISVGAVCDDGPGGTIEFVNCTVETTGKESVRIFDKSADKAVVRFVNCRFKDPWQVHHPSEPSIRVPILLDVRRPQLTQHVGGVEFVDCHLWDSVPRFALALAPKNSEHGVHNITGRIWVHGPHEPAMWLGDASTGIGLELVHVQEQPAAQNPESMDPPV